MRLIASIAAALFAVVLLGAVALYVLLQDPEHLKPELEAWLSERAGAEVRVRGDIAWQLSPFRLTAGQIEVRGNASPLDIGQLMLAVDLAAIWKDPEQWRVQGLTLKQVDIQGETGTTRVHTLRLTDFAFAQPTGLHLKATWQPSEAEAAPLDATVDGIVIYTPAKGTEPERVALRDTRVVSTLGSGTCELDATRGEPAAPAAPQPADAILPLDLLRSVDLASECSLTELHWEGETFRDGTLNATSVDGVLTAFLELRDFFSGKLTLDTEVRLLPAAPEWRVIPDLQGVDTQRFLNWRDSSARWLAAANATGELRFRGNSPQALRDSARGRLDFNANEGTINVQKLKQELTRIATLAGRADRIAERPDTWKYQTLAGNGRIDGRKLAFDLVLDNVSITGNGDYDYAADKVNVKGSVTVSEAPPGSPFVVNDLLHGTPIPARCRGSMSDVQCRIDNDAAKQLLAGALKSDSDTGLRRKIEDKIDENVPEEYREAARNLLDLLGRSLDKPRD